MLIFQRPQQRREVEYFLKNARHVENHIIADDVHQEFENDKTLELKIKKYSDSKSKILKPI